MAGDTLRGIGKKAIAEALEAAAAAEHATEPNGTTGAPQAAADFEARPDRSLDELPSERTGHPVNHSGPHGDSSITTATTLVQDASGAPISAAPPAEVDDAAPLTSISTPRSGPNRVSFGTMLGHEMHAVQARVAAAVSEVDAALRGTAHGRDVHLPAHPAMAVEPETVAASTSSPSLGIPAPHVQPAASPSSPSFAPVRDPLTEFSGGEHSFFDTAPVSDEYEPENPRGRLYTRLAVSGAVVAVVSVVVVAWINSHGSTEEPPIQVKAQPAVTAPAPAVAVTPPRPIAPPARLAEVPPTSTIPTSMPERIAVSVPPPPRPAKAPALAPPAPAPAPRPAPIAAAPSKPAPVASAPPKPAPIAAPAPALKPASVAAAAAPVRELRTPPAPPQKKPTAAATTAPRAPAPPPPRAAAPTPPPATRPAPPPVAKAPRTESVPARPVAKASPPARPSKASTHAKPKYDPDGTLPLSFE